MRWLGLLGFLLVTSAGTARAGQAGETPGFFDLSVPGGLATYEALGLRPEERATALALLARQLHGQGGERAARQLADVLVATSSPQASRPSSLQAGTFTIAAPLSEQAWRDVLPPGPDIFTSLVTHRGALLACAGALTTSPSVRTLLDRDRGLLQWLARTAPGAFTLAARSLRIEGGRVVVPGGAAAEPVWEAWLDARVTRPAEFIRALLVRDQGRMAWFFDSLASLDAARLAAVLPPQPAAALAERMHALYAPFRGIEENWRIETHPFLRHTADPWVVLTAIDLDNGVVAGPAWAWLWEALFDRPDIPRRDVGGRVRSGGAPVSVPWLVRQITADTPRERNERFDLVRFAQEVFAGVRDDQAADVLAALGGFRRYRAVLLALDRMGIADPATFARAVDAARRADARPGRERRQALVALQGALALVERVRVSRSIDATAAERLVRSLAAAVDRDTPTTRAVAQWLSGPFADALPPLRKPDRFTGTGSAYESKILQAMAGPPPSPPRALAWEGLAYDVDLAAAELWRLHRVRDHLESPGLDAAIASGNGAALGEALLALVYSAALGDPEGPALLGADVTARHRFGLEPPARSRREGVAWAPPRDLMGGGEPWHVEGALVGLDLGLARLALRRVADNLLPPSPTINLNDQMTLARTVVALNPRDLRDADRDRLVAAIERGRARVAAAGRDAAAVLALAAEARLPEAVRQTLPWMLARTPEAVPALFGYRDWLWLGEPDLPQPALDTWGMFAEPVDGRWRTRLRRPVSWTHLAGRPDTGALGAHTPDLTLRLAAETARLQLPAQLVPALLAFATQDYWHKVAARTSDDWPAMTRAALALSPERVEDYVAALAGDGPLRPR